MVCLCCWIVHDLTLALIFDVHLFWRGGDVNLLHATRAAPAALNSEDAVATTRESGSVSSSSV